jgi:hypothetical protein
VDDLRAVLRPNCGFTQHDPLISSKNSSELLCRTGQWFERKNGGLPKALPRDQRELTAVCAYIHNGAAAESPKERFVLNACRHAASEQATPIG